uniref:Major capsid protein N-terminal domain-containing protein n=1 Tax=viral metagenome TaxID=1070528 RepID=A0A6C0K4G8_9ZZZZ
MPAGGGLLQLVAQGKQDIFLTGNPQISYFKMVYRRYTNFAMESQPMYFDGTANFGQRISCLIPRRGDLLGKVYIDVLLPGLTLTDGTPVSYVNSIGNALIQEVTFEVGEQQIDKQTGEWMEIWEQLTTPLSQRDALNTMLGRLDGYPVPDLIPGTSSEGLRLYVPLQFYFCRNPGLYIPLLALQYHPIRINITIAPLKSLFYSTQLITVPNCTLTTNPASITSMMLWGDYIYLDVEERRRFVSKSHEYLIEQIQYTPLIGVTANQTQITIQTDFNHPIKEFIFVAKRDFMNQVNEPFNYSSLAINEALPAVVRPFLMPGQVRTDLIATALLQLDGYDRFQVRSAPYFRLVQPYDHHTTTPVQNFIYCYSLALRPEDAQPTGTLNASRIDSVNWQITMNANLNGTQGACSIRIYALNYNVFRVINGFGGVLFTI